MSAISRRVFMASTLAAGAGAAFARPWRPHRASTFFPWEEVRPGVWVSVSPALGGNVVVARGDDGCLVVDSKFAGMGTTLRREATELGGPVWALINTHHHGDHSGGNLAFHEDCDTYAHARAIERIAGAFEQYMGQVRGAERQMAGGGEVSEAVRAELEALLAREAELKAELWVPKSDIFKAMKQERVEGLDAMATKPAEIIPGVTILAMHFGAGHTDNDVVIHLPEANVVHTGDLCFNGRHPFFDTSGGANARGWIASLERHLKFCTAETIVVPGHGAIGDKSIIENQIAYIQRLVEAVGKELAAGRTRDEVMAMTWPFMEGFADQGRTRAIGAVYDELAAESAASGAR